MNALLGKITEIKKLEGSGALDVRFKAACVLPNRTKVPEWLNDQVLTIARDVPDAREVGYPGDSIVLTTEESARWLYPLTVTPDVSHGEIPEALQLRLRWWKEDKGPEFTVRANGQTQSGHFVKEGEDFVATIATASFFPFAPTLPVTFEISCDKLKAAATVLPQGQPGAHRVPLLRGERHRIENDWYAVDITAQVQSGGIAALREKGRGVDHFYSPTDLVQQPLEYGGHSDRLRTGWNWSEKLRDAALTVAGARREGAATRLSLEGVVDDGMGLRTTVAYTLYDELPLLLLQRDYHFGKKKEESGDKNKDEKPKEPIDDMQAVGLGFRAAWKVERDGLSGSRLLCAEGDRLAVIRGAETGEFYRGSHWRMQDGWAVAEHGGRREYTLYLFDAQTPPHLAMWLGPHEITLEPYWPQVPVRPSDSIGYGLGLMAGELCGASAEGAWVACRTHRPGGGVICAAVGRMKNAQAADEAAAFALSGETRVAALQRFLLPGVGPVLFATAEFVEGQMDAPFDVTFARIGARR